MEILFAEISISRAVKLYLFICVVLNTSIQNVVCFMTVQVCLEMSCKTSTIDFPYSPISA